MKVITKEIARQVAKEMAKPAHDRARELGQKYNDAVIAIYKAKVPQEIHVAFADKHLGPYIRRTDQIYVNGMGMAGHYSGSRVYIGGVLPS